MSFQWNSIEEFNKDFAFVEYVESIYGGKHNGSYLIIPCPFHNEITGSCAVYDHSFYCFGAGCGAHGSAIDFVMQTTGLSIGEILNGKEFRAVSKSESKDYRKSKTFSYPPYASIRRYQRDLFKDQVKLAYLYNRHFDKQSIENSLIGYVKTPKMFARFSNPRFSIPVFDKNEQLISARYRIDPEYDDDEEPKYLAHPNAPVALYNQHLLDLSENIVIVGSELDAAFLYYRYGIYAVAPPGEGNFKSEWAADFRDHNVLVWLDYDHAGINAAIKTYNILRLISKSKIYVWDSTYRNKDDICDFVTRESIMGVIEALDRYDVKAYI